MKVFKGYRTVTGVGGQKVTVNDKPLPHKVKHSPTGFNWAYGGSGPADLARSILFEIYGKEFADRYYQKFKWDVIANLPKSDWILTEREIENWKKTLSIGEN